MRTIDTGPNSAANNMAIDKQLLSELANTQEAVLHFYEWNAPSATYGHFIDPYKFLNKNISLDLARRPTGGGIILHLTDLAFSVIVPGTHPASTLNTMDNYRFIHERVIEALTLFNPLLKMTLLPIEPPAEGPCCGFCMVKPTQYDVMADGRKIAGGAQRRTRHGYLHQGSICVALPEDEDLKDVFSDPATWPGMQANSYALVDDAQQAASAKAAIKEHLAQVFTDALRR